MNQNSTIIVKYQK